MVRTQVLLEEEQHEFLKARARDTGESLSALVRRAVDELRRKQSWPPKEELLALCGAFEGDDAAVSVVHDAYLTRAIEGGREPPA